MDLHPNLNHYRQRVDVGKHFLEVDFMKRTVAPFVSGCLVALGTLVLVHAPGGATPLTAALQRGGNPRPVIEDRDQVRPGEPTPARVWIQNQGKEEAVPVQIIEPSSVTVTGTPAVALVHSSAVVQTRGSRQAWEYRALTVPANQEAAAVLSGAGQDGWETTGLQFPAQGGVLVILKRPKG